MSLPRPPLVLVLAALTGLLLGATKVGIGDIFWHAAMGKEMLSHGALLTVDPFSFSFPNQPLTVHSPLFQVLAAVAHEAGGWPAIVALRGLVYVGLIGLVGQWLRQRGMASPAAATAGAVLVVIAQPQLPFHPQLFLVVLAAALAFILDLDLDLDRRRRWGLVTLILTLWSGLHSSFPLGFAFVVPFALDHEDRWRELACAVATIVLTCMVVLAVHPSIVVHILRHGTDGSLNELGFWRSTVEVLAPSPHGQWILAALAVGAALSAVGLVDRRRHGDRWRAPLVVVAIVFYLALRHVRFYPLALLVAVPLAAPVERFRRAPTRFRIAAAVSLAFTAIVSWTFLETSPERRYGFSVDEERVPLDAIEYLREHAGRRRMFHAYNYGGVIMLYLGPAKQVLIDPRYRMLYPEAFLQAFGECYRDPRRFEEFVGRYDLSLAFLPKASLKTQGLIAWLDEHPAWTRVHDGPIAVVFEREARAGRHRSPATRDVRLVNIQPGSGTLDR